MSLATFLNTSATLQRNTPTKDAVGGSVASWSTVTTFSCARWNTDDRLVRLFAQDMIKGTHVFATDSDLGVKPTDRVLIGSTYYRVEGSTSFQNASILGGATLYLISATDLTL